MAPTGRMIACRLFNLAIYVLSTSLCLPACTLTTSDNPPKQATNTYTKELFLFSFFSLIHYLTAASLWKGHADSTSTVWLSLHQHLP